MIRKCEQTKCTFHEQNGHSNLCPRCSECGAKSNEVEDDLCVNCHNCLNDEGYVRDGTIEKAENEIIICEKNMEMR